MRVIHSTPAMGPSYGGPFHSVRGLACAQRERGIEGAVWMPASEEARLHAGVWEPVPLHLVGRRPLPPFGYAPGFTRALLDTDADILHTHGIWQHPSWCALRWKRATGRPHVASIRGMLEPWAWRHHRLRKRPVWHAWERRNLQSASLLHATAPAEADALRARGLTAPIAVVPNGVELPDEVEEVPGAAVGPRQVLFLGRIHPKKGIDLFLQSWSRAAPPNWRLTVAGPDESGCRAGLEALAAELGLADRVSFPGPLYGEDREAAFRACDLFVLPTHSENFGMAVAEALARGRPVITTHGAPWAALVQERCGWWVEVSVDGLAAAITEAAGCNGDDLAAMGRRGRRMIERDFSWEQVARVMEECYRWLLGGDRPECVQQDASSSRASVPSAAIHDPPRPV